MSLNFQLISCLYCNIYPESYFELSCTHTFCTGCINYHCIKNPEHLKSEIVYCIECSKKTTLNKKIIRFFENYQASVPQTYKDEQELLSYKRSPNEFSGAAKKNESAELEFEVPHNKISLEIQFKKNINDNILAQEHNYKFLEKQLKDEIRKISQDKKKPDIGLGTDPSKKPETEPPIKFERVLNKAMRN